MSTEEIDPRLCSCHLRNAQKHDRQCYHSFKQWTPAERCVQVAMARIQKDTDSIEDLHESLVNLINNGENTGSTAWNNWEQEVKDRVQPDAVRSLGVVMFEYMSLISNNGQKWSMGELAGIMMWGAKMPK